MIVFYCVALPLTISLSLSYPPTPTTRFLINKLLVKNVHSLDVNAIELIVSRSSGYSGADVHALCSEAAMGPIRDIATRGTGLNSVQGISALSEDNLRPIQYSDFEAAFRQVKASVAPKEVQQYLDWNKMFGSWALEGETTG